MCLSLAKVPKVIITTTTTAIIYRVPTRGFPGGTVVKNPSAKAGGVQFLRWEEPLEKEVATHSSILA